MPGRPDSWASPVDPPPPRCKTGQWPHRLTTPRAFLRRCRWLPPLSPDSLRLQGFLVPVDQRGELDADLYLLPLHRTRYTHVLMDRWWLQWTNTTVPYPCQTHVHTIALKSTTLAGTTTVFVGVPKSVGNPVFAGAPATFLRSLPVSLKLGILCPRESRLSGGSSFARLCDLGGNLKDTGRPYACTHAPTTHSPHGPFRPSPAHLDAKVADWSDRTKAEYAFVRMYQPSTCCQMCMPFWHDTPSRLPLGPTSSGRQMSKVDRIQLGFGTVRHINQVIRQGHATRRRKVMGNGRSRRHAHAPTEQTKNRPKQTRNVRCTVIQVR